MPMQAHRAGRGLMGEVRVSAGGKGKKRMGREGHRSSGGLPGANETPRNAAAGVATKRRLGTDRQPVKE